MQSDTREEERNKNFKFAHLYKTQKEMRKQQNEILQTLNDGLKSDVKNNKKCISSIEDDISEIKEVIITEDAINQSDRKNREKIYWLIISLLALSQIGQIFDLI